MYTRSSYCNLYVLLLFCNQLGLLFCVKTFYYRARHNSALGSKVLLLKLSAMWRDENVFQGGCCDEKGLPRVLIFLFLSHALFSEVVPHVKGRSLVEKVGR